MSKGAAGPRCDAESQTAGRTACPLAAFTKKIRLVISRQSLAQRGAAYGYQNPASCLPAGGPPCRHQEKSLSSRAPPLLRHPFVGSRRRSAHHPDLVRPSRSERNRSLSPPLTTALACHSQSAGRTGAEERQAVPGGVDESATVRSGRYHSQRRHRLHREEPFVAPLDPP